MSSAYSAVTSYDPQTKHTFGGAVQSRKVFGIGFHKTGTTTLASALRMLGYRVTGPFGVDTKDIAATAVDRALQIAKEWDAVQDNPWPLVFRELDEQFPGSRFVLTVRNTDQWLASVVQHFGGKTTPMRTWIYGVGDPVGNEEVYRRRIEEHNQEVSAYFRDRPDDLLVLRIADGQGWEKLCPFLGVTTPDDPFPHANSHRERRLGRKIQRRLRKFFAGR